MSKEAANKEEKVKKEKDKNIPLKTRMETQQEGK